MGAREQAWKDVQTRCKLPGSVVLQQWTTQRANDKAAWIGALVEAAGQREMRRMFAAAETPAWVSSWPTDGGNLNQNLERGLAIAVRRARQHTQDNDWGRRFLLQMRTSLLGPTGMPLQMRHKKRGGNAHEAINESVEAWWSAWCREGSCELTGKHAWKDCERLAIDHLCRDGEILARELVGRGPMGYQIQLLDPTLLDPSYRSEYAGRRIRMSIELDDDNRPVAYWLRSQYAEAGYVAKAYDGGQRVRIPADEIIHAFIAEEADQLRGFPWMLAGMRRLRLLGDFEESAAVASSNAAKRVGFFTAPNGDPGSPPGFADQIVSAALDAAKASGKILTPAEIEAITAAAQRFSTTAPGQYDTLPTGYTFTPFQSDYPHINYGEYVRECVRGFTGGLGLSHATGGNNLENVNMSSARVGILDERELYKTLQDFVARKLHARVFKSALRIGLIASPLLARVPPSQYEALLCAATWGKRRWQDPDPVKKANSDAIRLQNRLTSPQRVMLENGDEPEEVMEEIAEWEARFGPLTAKPAAPGAGAAAAAPKNPDTESEKPDAEEGADVEEQP